MDPPEILKQSALQRFPLSSKTSSGEAPQKPTIRIDQKPQVNSKESSDSNSSAYSNLQCPSPPPILNKPSYSQSNINAASTLLKNGNQINDIDDVLKESSKSQSPTIAAGGAVLSATSVGANNTNSASNATTSTNISSPLNSNQFNSPSSASSGHLSPELQNLDSLNLSSTGQINHQKSPSVHAHFYVEDVINHPRSRSNSGSVVERSDQNVADTLEGVNKGLSIPPPHLANATNNLATISNRVTSPLSNNVNSSTENNPPREQNANIDPRLPQDDGKLHILLGACGAISINKIRLIITKLEEIYGNDKISIQLILTKSSEHFVSRGEFPSNVTIWRDKDEWSTWGTRSDPVLHIELRRWADILIVSPLTANTLSKIALGLCDNLLTNVIRAWNTQYPILLAPAMVSYAYNSAATKRHLKLIKEEMPWIEVLKPVEKVVGSYGDIGMGGMMDWNEIVNKIVMKLGGYPEDEDDDNDDNDDNDNEAQDQDEDDEDQDDDSKELVMGVRKLTVAEEDKLKDP